MKQTLFVFMLLGALTGCETDSNNDLSANINGVGGSLARFTISDNHLYIVDGQNLQSYDISEPSKPVKSDNIEIGFGIETIFAYKDNLFIGSQTGMHIFDISNPSSPQHLSTYQHVRSCDPVVVQGKYAYVTLRDGTECRFGQNLLDVIDISDLRNPVHKQSYPMHNPRGLGINGNALFVCEGDQGFKIFDASKTPSLVELGQVKAHFSNDVIPLDEVLLIIGKDGLYQYDYSNLDKLELLSSIPFK